MYAQFDIRQKDLLTARKTLGLALGKCPRPKLFKGYIELELQLREFDRCRKLYDKCLEFNPSNCTMWIMYAELEMILGDAERARAIFELAIDQPLIDMPEILWKAFIDFEEEAEKVRNLYERLLDRTQHVKERAMLLEAWYNFEIKHGDLATQEKIKKQLPRKVKKKRKLYLNDGLDGGWEEYWDYVFPGDYAVELSLKLLQMARK